MISTTARFLQRTLIFVAATWGFHAMFFLIGSMVFLAMGLIDGRWEKAAYLGFYCFLVFEIGFISSQLTLVRAIFSGRLTKRQIESAKRS